MMMAFWRFFFSRVEGVSVGWYSLMDGVYGIVVLKLVEVPG